MNSSTKPFLFKSERQIPITEQVYSIIDSKIQYADYLTQLAIQPFVDRDSLQGGATFSHKGTRPNYGYGQVGGAFLIQIERTSKVKRLLLIIRSKLCIQNAQTSFDLLTDDRYLDFSDKALTSLLETAILG